MRFEKREFVWGSLVSIACAPVHFPVEISCQWTQCSNESKWRHRMWRNLCDDEVWRNLCDDYLSKNSNLTYVMMCWCVASRGLPVGSLLGFLASLAFFMRPHTFLPAVPTRCRSFLDPTSDLHKWRSKLYNWAWPYLYIRVLHT